MPKSGSISERGAASVEYVALVAAIGLIFVAVVAALIAGPSRDSSRQLGGLVARRVVCAAKLRTVCRRDQLVLAYGRPLAKLVRALAPPPAARAGAAGLPLVGVDFRYCRSSSCAVPGQGAHLTTSGRRTTAFTSVVDRRRRDGVVEVTYWLYRPTLGWERVTRRADGGDVAAAASARLRAGDDPALVPLETLPGRNHYRFPAAEEPPWRWRVPGRYPG